MQVFTLSARRGAAAAALAMLALAGCTGTDFERGALGAGGGALASKALGGDPVTGALVGGAAGVLCDDVSPQVCRR